MGSAALFMFLAAATGAGRITADGHDICSVSIEKFGVFELDRYPVYSPQGMTPSQLLMMQPFQPVVRPPGPAKVPKLHPMTWQTPRQKETTAYDPFPASSSHYPD